jgi:hypothetical protein
MLLYANPSPYTRMSSNHSQHDHMTTRQMPSHVYMPVDIPRHYYAPHGSQPVGGYWSFTSGESSSSLPQHRRKEVFLTAPYHAPAGSLRPVQGYEQRRPVHPTPYHVTSRVWSPPPRVTMENVSNHTHLRDDALSRISQRIEYARADTDHANVGGQAHHPLPYEAAAPHQPIHIRLPTIVEDRSVAERPQSPATEQSTSILSKVRLSTRRHQAHLVHEKTRRE